MKGSRRLLWGMGLALVFLAGISFEKAFAQPQQKDWLQEEATLRPTSIRKRSLGCRDRKRATSRTMTIRQPSRGRTAAVTLDSATIQRWLGPTETRMADPVYAEAVENVNKAIHRKEVESIPSITS